MGEDKGVKKRKQEAEDRLREATIENTKAATAALQTAGKPTPWEQTQMDKAVAMQNWESGKAGPVQVRDMPGGMVDLDLYEQAKKVSDAGRIGKGFGTMSDGANPNYVAKLEHENQLQRDLAASGALESNVNARIAESTGEGFNLANMYDTRAMNMAGLTTGREQSTQQQYLNFLMRPRPPSFLRQLAMSTMQGLTQVGSAYLTGGGSLFSGAGADNPISRYPASPDVFA